MTYKEIIKALKERGEQWQLVRIAYTTRCVMEKEMLNKILDEHKHCIECGQALDWS